MPKCAYKKCGNKFKVQDAKDYYLVKDKSGKKYRFDSAECLKNWISEKISIAKIEKMNPN